jgi:hypothetical protein
MITLSFDHGFVRKGEKVEYFDGQEVRQGFVVCEADDDEGGAYISPGESWEEALRSWLSAAKEEGFDPETGFYL